MSASRAPEQPHVPAPSEIFVGREAELARLDVLLTRAIAGAGSLVFVTGDSGMGKTAIVDEFLRRARPREPSLGVSFGRCAEQYGAGEAFLPFLDVLSDLLRGPGHERAEALLRLHAPTWCLQIPTMRRGAQALRERTVGANKERMLRELGDAIQARAAGLPTVFVLEDFHWADPSSVDVLRHLGRRAADHQILVLATCKPPDLDPVNRPLLTATLEMRAHSYCHEVGLGPLEPGHVASYLDARFNPHAFPSSLGGLIHAKTEGHPLFVANLVQFLRERGDIVWDGTHWGAPHVRPESELDAPESVRSLIRRKTEALGEHDRTALQYASVMGREVLSSVLGSLVEEDELAVQERMDRLDRVHRLVQTLGEEELPDGTLAVRYRFAHTLYQEVLYDDLVSKRRMLLHRQVGERLIFHYAAQAPRIATQLALHFERARDFASAVTHLLSAAGNAAELYANGEAHEHLTHALRLVEKLPREQQAKASLLLYQKRGAANLGLSRFDMAAEDYTRTLEWARAGADPVSECAALSGLCYALFFSNRVEEMGVRAQEALGTATRAGRETLRVEAMTLLALMLQDTGRLAESRPLLDEVVGTARRLGHKPSLLLGSFLRGSVHYWQTEYTAAEQRLAEAIDLASELRDGFLLLGSRMFLGLTQACLGRTSQALTTLQEGIAMARRNGDHFWLPRLTSHVGFVYRELQDFEQALAHDREGLRIARDHGILEAEAAALLNLFLDHSQGGHHDEAASGLAELEDISKRAVWFGWLHRVRLETGLAEYWLGRGEAARGRDHATRALDAATSPEARIYAASAHQLFAEAELLDGDAAAAATEVAAAWEALAGQPAPLFAWRMYGLLARICAALGDDEAARQAHGEAAAVVGGIADQIEDAALRATFLGSRAVRKLLDGGAAGVTAS